MVVFCGQSTWPTYPSGIQPLARIIILNKLKIAIPHSRPHRLTVRTPGSHPGNRGSIPRAVTMKKGPSAKMVLFSWSRGVEPRLPKAAKRMASGGSLFEDAHRNLFRARRKNISKIFPCPSNLLQLIGRNVVRDHDFWAPYQAYFEMRKRLEFIPVAFSELFCL